MLNLTSRLAIEIRDIPNGVDWSDQSPQGRRSQLTAADILPGIEDALALQKRALVFLQQFLVSEFDDLHELQSLTPVAHSSDTVKKSEVVPMRILFRDEKYVAENVAILGDLIRDANLTGSHQVYFKAVCIHVYTCMYDRRKCTGFGLTVNMMRVYFIFLRRHVHVYLQVVVGDQMTCKNIRSARALMQPEINPLKQLNWVHEVPGKQLHVYSCTYTWKITYLYLQVHVRTCIYNKFKSMQKCFFHLSKTPM